MSHLTPLHFRWKYEGVLTDVDGTLTGGSAGRSVVPKMNILPPSCSKSDDFSKGGVEGYICDPAVKFNRFAFNKPDVSFVIVDGYCE